MDKKTDRRVLKTKRAIYNAFVELLSGKKSIILRSLISLKKQISTVKHSITTIQISMKLWKR